MFVKTSSSPTSFARSTNRAAAREVATMTTARSFSLCAFSLRMAASMSVEFRRYPTRSTWPGSRR
jgi:hypothetical protein